MLKTHKSTKSCHTITVVNRNTVCIIHCRTGFSKFAKIVMPGISGNCCWTVVFHNNLGPSSVTVIYFKGGAGLQTLPLKIASVAPLKKFLLDFIV